MVKPNGTQAPPDKSVGAALLLTFLFGPLGLFYLSAGAALIMFVIVIVVGFLTLGVGLVFVWPATMIWSAALASRQHTEHQVWLAQRSGTVSFAAPVVPPAPVPPAPVMTVPPRPALESQPVPALPPKADITWLRAGEQRLLGYTLSPPYYGIWDRQRPGPPDQKYPYTEHGKTEAEARFLELEPRSVQGGPEARPQPPNAYGFE